MKPPSLVLLEAYACLTLLSCAPMRSPVSPGTIPDPQPLTAQERALGEQAFRKITSQYPVLRDREAKAEVARVVERLGRAAGSGSWRTVLLNAPNIANAGATRGNYIFVWSGMLQAVRSEEELATVMAHEMGHILAQHTIATPDEQLNEVLSGLSGEAARRALLRQGSIGSVASIAQVLAQQAFRAGFINPESQRKELEADIIGLHLMAEAGYDPRSALEFWRRGTLAGGEGPLEFLSSHPSSQTRIENLREQMPMALERHDRRYY
ncbi:MAG: M48 family metallopeptidase [Deltaproteobacteria bacterium]|nr:M48 family metallopeptidase [Deltaproteobacteria bacterium]